MRQPQRLEAFGPLAYPDHDGLIGTMTLEASERALIEAVVEAMGHSQSILVITGAGVSATSGIDISPVEIGHQGSILKHHGKSLEEVFSAKSLQENPRYLRRFILELIESHQAARPSRAHQIIATMEQSFERFWVLTQNVDGLHQRAGSRNVIEIHGNIQNLRCPSCTQKVIYKINDATDCMPPCSACGEMLRPDMTLFGETLDPDTARLYQRELNHNFDLVFSIGTSSQFPYIQRPVREGASRGRLTVEINPDNTAVSDVVDIRLRKSADDALTAIWGSYLRTQNQGLLS